MGESERVLPFFFLAYEEELGGVGRAWVARSIGTGHVSMGSTRERAIECLRGTIEMSVQLAEEAGHTLEGWLKSQRPDETRFVNMFLEAAQTRGLEVVPCYEERVAMVPRAA